MRNALYCPIRARFPRSAWVASYSFAEFQGSNFPFKFEELTQRNNPLPLTPPSSSPRRITNGKNKEPLRTPPPYGAFTTIFIQRFFGQAPEAGGFFLHRREDEGDRTRSGGAFHSGTAKGAEGKGGRLHRGGQTPRLEVPRRVEPSATTCSRDTYYHRPCLRRGRGRRRPCW